MFILCFALPLLSLSVFCHLRHKTLLKREVVTDWATGMAVSMIFGLIILTLSIFVTMVSYAFQIQDFEELKKLDKYEQIYLSKSEVLTKRFEKYLLEIYPQHEKDIYNKIKPQDVDIYLVRYPELRASETIKLLVEQIRTLQNDYYAQGLLKASIVKLMVFRTKDPWLYHFLIPEYKE